MSGGRLTAVSGGPDGQAALPCQAAKESFRYGKRFRRAVCTRRIYE
jgi:hypothetical protein